MIYVSNIMKKLLFKIQRIEVVEPIHSSENASDASV